MACTRPSAVFRAVINSSNFLSSAECASASLTIWSISSSDNPLDALITIDCSLPVALSVADTLRIPLASKSKATSTWGIPRGAGGISFKSNLPRDLFWAACFLSPCTTWMVTAVWLSSAVEKTCVFFVGIVVFFSISALETPPRVSMPRDRGVTSSRSTSFTSPDKTAAWIDAPTATASSGFTSLRDSFPKKSVTFCWTKGMRVWPPTKITSSIFDTSRSASWIATFKGSKVLSTKSSTKDSNFARVSFWTKCLGPEASAVM